MSKKISPERLRELLRPFGELRPQAREEWTGIFPLPEEIARFYEEIGPVDLNIPGYGNSYSIPRLSKSWALEQSWHWDSHGDPLWGWNPDWIVVADCGDDPYIYSITSGKILFDYHDGGGVKLVEGKWVPRDKGWDPQLMFDDLETMAATLAIMGGIVRDHYHTDLCDEKDFIRPVHINKALEEIGELLQSREEALIVLGTEGWIWPWPPEAKAN